MKKLIIIALFLVSCFLIHENVNAQGLYDYYYTTMTFSGVGSTGSQNPGIVTANAKSATLVFGYYNLNDTIVSGERGRIVARYCSYAESPGFDNMSYSLTGSVDMKLVNFEYEYTDEMCIYTATDGNVSVGSILEFTIDFIVDYEDTTSAGFVNITFNKSSTASKWFVAFDDYRLYFNDEITDIENTQDVIDNNNQNTQDVIDNNNQNTQDIIDNNNQNTQDVVDSIKGDCVMVPKKNLFKSIYLTNSTSMYAVNLYATVDLKPNTTYTLSFISNYTGSYFYTNEGVFTKAVWLSTTAGQRVSVTLTTRDSATLESAKTSNGYAILKNRLALDSAVIFSEVQLEEGSVFTSYSEYEEEEVCEGGLSGSINDVNDSINDLKDSVTSEASPDLGSLSDSAGWLPAGPVDSIINLPLTFFNSLTDSLSKTCKPVQVPLPFVDKNIELPCLNSIYEQIDGLTIWINSIGIIASAFILYKYLLSLYKWVDDTLTMRENTWQDWGGV